MVTKMPLCLFLAICFIAGFSPIEKPAFGEKLKRQNTPCVEIFDELARAYQRGLYEKGEEIPISQLSQYGLDFLKLKDGTKVFLLGQGSTAHSFRIVTPAGSSYLLKRYSKRDVNDRVDRSDENFARDQHFMKLFREASKKDATETMEVLVVEKEFKDAMTVKFKDFKGFSVDDIANLLRRNNPEKLAVFAKEFNRRLANFVEDLKSSGLEIREFPKEPWNPEFDVYQLILPNSTEIVAVGITSNVIFDPQTGRFVIIDPF